MVVELISVGTEILLGNIVNTNAAFLSEKCAGLGLSCYYQNCTFLTNNSIPLTINNLDKLCKFAIAK